MDKKKPMKVSNLQVTPTFLTKKDNRFFLLARDKDKYITSLGVISGKQKLELLYNSIKELIIRSKLQKLPPEIELSKLDFLSERPKNLKRVQTDIESLNHLLKTIEEILKD